MSITEIRRQAKRRIDQLSPERLQVAEDFLAYLAEREANDATEELMRIPGLLEDLEESKKDLAAGKTVDWRDVRNDV